LGGIVGVMVARTLSLGAFWLAAAVFFGFAAQAGDHFIATPYMLTSLGAPWLILAFAAGATTRRTRHGALAGGVVLVVATAAYYTVLLGQHGPGSARYAALMLFGWGAAASLAGVVLGAAGSQWRRGARAASDAARRHRAFLAAAALPGAALVAEAVVLFAEPRFVDAQRLLALEAFAGVALWCVLARGRLVVTVTAGLLLVVPMALATDGIRSALHAAGWAGA
jgi:hypothetical protein